MNPEEEVEKIQAFMAEKLDEANADGFVLGVSGGLDSTVVAILADQNHKLVPVSMPSTVNLKEGTRETGILAKQLAHNVLNIPITAISETVETRVGPGLGQPGLGQVATGNVHARARMMILYAIANEHNLLVLGTGNKSELMTGYFTKHGDGACDLLPIGHLYKTEVYELAEHLDVPDEIIEQPPSAGLWEGQTDEAELGLTYEQLDMILVGFEDIESPRDILDEAAMFMNRVDPDITRGDVENVIEMIEQSEHKRQMPPIPDR